MLTDVMMGTVDKVGTKDTTELEFTMEVFRTSSVPLEVLTTEVLDTTKEALDVMLVTFSDKLKVIVGEEG